MVLRLNQRWVWARIWVYSCWHRQIRDSQCSSPEWDYLWEWKQFWHDYPEVHVHRKSDLITSSFHPSALGPPSNLLRLDLVRWDPTSQHHASGASDALNVPIVWEQPFDDGHFSWVSAQLRELLLGDKGSWLHEKCIEGLAWLLEDRGHQRHQGVDKSSQTQAWHPVETQIPLQS